MTDEAPRRRRATLANVAGVAEQPATDATLLMAAQLQARATCVEAALVQRHHGEPLEATLARAEAFWAWVQGDNRKAP